MAPLRFRYRCKYCNSMQKYLPKHLRGRCVVLKGRRRPLSLRKRQKRKAEALAEAFRLQEHQIVGDDEIIQFCGDDPANLQKVRDLLQSLGHVVVERPTLVQKRRGSLTELKPAAKLRRKVDRSDGGSDGVTEKLNEVDEVPEDPVAAEPSSQLLDDELGVLSGADDEGDLPTEDENLGDDAGDLDKDGLVDANEIEDTTQSSQFGEREAGLVDMQTVSKSEDRQPKVDDRCTLTRMAIRQKMRAMGLYSGVKESQPVLIAFREFYEQKLGQASKTQATRRLSRLLRYAIENGSTAVVDVKNLTPEEVTSLILCEGETIELFYEAAKSCGLSAQGRRNYEICVRLMTEYLAHDGKLPHCISKKLLVELAKQKFQAKGTSRKIAKERVKQRYAAAANSNISMDFLQIFDLDCVVDDWNRIVQKSTDGEELTDNERIRVVRHLVATLMLQHFQRRGVAESLTVEEYLDGAGHDGAFRVKDHKTATTQLAIFDLNDVELAKFKFYFEQVRSILAAKVPRSERADAFFLTTNGTALCNASRELNRFQKWAGVEKTVSGSDARKAIETFSALKLDSEADKKAIARYLAHSTDTARRHYEEASDPAVHAAGDVVRKVKQRALEECEVKAMVDGEANVVDFDEAHLLRLCTVAFPVHAGGRCPTKSKVLRDVFLVPNDRAATAKEQSTCKRVIDNYRTLLANCRADELSSFFRAVPAREAVMKKATELGFVNRKGELSSRTMNRVLELCALNAKQRSRAAAAAPLYTDDDLVELMQTQKWPGVAISCFDGRGRGVVATMPLWKGTCVCSYDGKLMKAKNGERFLETLNDKSRSFVESYLLELVHSKVNGSKHRYYIFAHEELADGGQQRASFGRLLNHSKKHPNCQLRLVTSDDKLCGVVFIAKRDILPGEELLWDYGDKYEKFDWFNICPCKMCSSKIV